MDTNSKQLIIIAGPTAVGKTDISIQLAQEFNSPIISCDSRQIYKEMNIGTAKPSSEELSTVPHHFINHLSVQEPYSAGKYELESVALTDLLYKSHDTIILTGGTGLYMNALLYGMDNYPDVATAILKQLDTTFQEKGLSDLLKQLEEKDPAYYKTVDKNNSRRIIRALSVIEQSGETFTSFRLGKPKKRSFTPIYILLNRDREGLYHRINERVDLMLSQGLEAEARNLYQYKNLKALQTVGYQELFDYFDEKISFVKAVDLIKQNSRRYAKRQLTWYRKNDHWKSFHPSQYADIIKYLKLI